ncbi:MAG: L-aspartate oxidase [Campylobacterales bacterium]
MIDVLIIGAGVAGLYTAINLPRNLKVLVLSKSEPSASNTYWAQGGIAVSKDEFDVGLHIKDTMDAGAGHCDKTAVEMLCKNSMGEIQNLIKMGMKFDTNEDGEPLLTREAAHSAARILHADGDATGRMLFEFLYERCPCEVRDHAVVVDLLVENGVCYGVTVLNKDEKLENIYAKKVVIASGGVGSLYKYSTNDTSISADLHGMILEHGGALQDMEMMQFHPTVYHDSRFARKVLLTEALRGEGAYVVDDDGKRFLFDYDERGELAPRDILSRAVVDYTKKSGKQAYLSFDVFDKEFFMHRFPNIYANMKSLGFDLPSERVPIYPAFHYSIGGIKCSLDTKVDGFTNLFVVGEAASNRVHGANRLASNSLLEGLVFGRVAADTILADGFDDVQKEFAVIDEPLFKEGDTNIKGEIRELMWNDVSIARRVKDLEAAGKKLDALIASNPGRMARLRLKVAKNMVESALNRRESLGAHYITNEEG